MCSFCIAYQKHESSLSAFYPHPYITDYIAIFQICFLFLLKFGSKVFSQIMLTTAVIRQDLAHHGAASNLQFNEYIRYHIGLVYKSKQISYCCLLSIFVIDSLLPLRFKS